MPNNTETYWDADGTSLHTYAWSIETIGGMGPPPLKGEDIGIPHKHGQQWMPKSFDANTLTLAIQLRGVDQSAGAGAVAATREKYQENWNDLIRLLWTPGRQVALTKRFYDQGFMRTATAMVEYLGGMQPTLIGRSAARCTVDLKVAGGVFYDSSPQTFNLVAGDQTINVRGNAPTRNIELTFNGARDKPQVRRKSPGLDHQVQYFKNILSGDYATLDIMNQEATHVGEGPTFESTLDVRTSGAPYWLELQPGNNVVNFSANSGLGSAQLVVRGAWI